MTTKSQTAATTAHPTIVSSVVFTLLKIIFCALLAWMALTIWFLVVLIREGVELTALQASNIVVGNAHFMATSHAAFASTLSAWFIAMHSYFFSFLHSVTSMREAFIQGLLTLFVSVTEIDVSRLFIFILATPLFVIGLGVFFIDGLVKRDVRKFQGARESTLRFHRFKRLQGFAFFIPFFIYLSAPVSFSPVLFLVPEVFLLGLVTRTTVTYFKKYV